MYDNEVQVHPPKFIILWVALCALCLHFAPVALAGAACTGAANCTACLNCKYCRHCAKEGGTCGVKDRLLGIAPTPAPAASPALLGAVAASVPPPATSVVLAAPVNGSSVALAPEPPAPPVPSVLLSMQPAAPVSTCLTAIAAQSDPAKLATLGERGANRRLKRIMYYLAQARAGGADPGELIDQAQGTNDSAGTPRAPLVKASLLRNLKICDGLGLLTPENLWRLRHGNAPVVTRGPYVGQIAEVDHIVLRSRSPETDNELANLEMLPAGLNRSKGAKVGERQLALAKKFREAGLISDETMAMVQARFVPSGTRQYELQEP